MRIGDYFFIISMSCKVNNFQKIIRDKSKVLLCYYGIGNDWEQVPLSRIMEGNAVQKCMAFSFLDL